MGDAYEAMDATAANVRSTVAFDLDPGTLRQIAATFGTATGPIRFEFNRATRVLAVEHGGHGLVFPQRTPEDPT